MTVRAGGWEGGKERQDVSVKESVVKKRGAEVLLAEGGNHERGKGKAHLQSRRKPDRLRPFTPSCGRRSVRPPTTTRAKVCQATKDSSEGADASADGFGEVGEDAGGDGGYCEGFFGWGGGEGSVDCGV
jgi:hypothetical protein